MIIVTDSSPLISLAILNELKLLSKLFTEIYIPEAVFNEITQSDKPFF
jgi:predicted nucleic acid-binding protein